MLSLLLIAQVFAFAPESKLWIEGDSNLHPWSCQATSPEAQIEIDTSAPELARRLSLSLQVNGLECGSGKMNDKLRDALNADTHPVIEYRLTKSERVPGDALQLKATGELTLNGNTRPITFTVDVVLDPDGTARASGSVDILMTDFGVDPPTALIFLKTYDLVTVKFEIHAIPRSGPHASLP
jgi:polyisoprenoid-binding protein YceI